MKQDSESCDGIFTSDGQPINKSHRFFGDFCVILVGIVIGVGVNRIYPMYAF
jgi:hypothetical protein